VHCSRASTCFRGSKILKHVVSVRAKIGAYLAAVQKIKKPTEPETEKELIWPTLEALGWQDALPQQNLSFGGREKVPDGLLFGDSTSKDKAGAEKGAGRFRHGLCIMEAKRFSEPRRNPGDVKHFDISGTQLLDDWGKILLAENREHAHKHGLAYAAFHRSALHPQITSDSNGPIGLGECSGAANEQKVSKRA
jgi:hypothetical protein